MTRMGEGGGVAVAVVLAVVFVVFVVFVVGVVDVSKSHTESALASSQKDLTMQVMFASATVVVMVWLFSSYKNNVSVPATEELKTLLSWGVISKSAP